MSERDAVGPEIATKTVFIFKILNISLEIKTFTFPAINIILHTSVCAYGGIPESKLQTTYVTYADWYRVGTCTATSVSKKPLYSDDARTAISATRL